MKELQIKRVYEKPSSDDGVRILVDRLWPRGVKKEDAHLNFWLKDIAPSPDLRKWFDHKPERFDEFSKKYTDELKYKKADIDQIRDILKDKDVSLIYAAKDPEINQAIVLKNFIEHS